MTRFSLIIALVLLAEAWRPLQAKQPASTTVTICDLVQRPELFSGRMIRVRAHLINPRRPALEDDTCGRVLLAFPDDYEVLPKPSFKLVRDAKLEKLMDSESVLLPAPSHKPGKITATFEGRFDSVFVLRNGRKVQRSPQSIRLAADEFRLVLHRVLEVQVQPISSGQ